VDGVRTVAMHDGSLVRFRRVADDYDPSDRQAAYAHAQALHARGEVATGLLYLGADGADMHAVEGTVEGPLHALPYDSLCPGRAALDELMAEMR
jgi:2-oxoglutarate/2-oxoacid ferredoxin oxidoreductase subunit beta